MQIFFNEKKIDNKFSHLKFKEKNVIFMLFLCFVDEKKKNLRKINYGKNYCIDFPMKFL